MKAGRKERQRKERGRKEEEENEGGKLVTSLFLLDVYYFDVCRIK